MIIGHATTVGHVGYCYTIQLSRFEKLEQYLHVSNRSTEKEKNDPEYDKLCKSRPMLAESVKKYYTLGEFMSVDESMIAFTGRFSFKQHLPKKSIKRGTKIWARSDATSGYMDAFNVYLGKCGGGCPLGIGHYVVSKLVNDVHQSYHKVFADSFHIREIGQGFA